MYLIQARTGNYLLDVKRGPTWTPHRELAMRIKTSEMAEVIREDLQEFWGVQVKVVPFFSPNRFEPTRDYRTVGRPNPKLSPFASANSVGHFEYTN